MKPGQNPRDSGYAIESLHAHRLMGIFRAKRIFYYESSLHEGVLVEHNKKRFFELLYRFAIVTGLWMRRYSSVRKEYLDKHASLTSEFSWRRMLSFSESSPTFPKT